jgi:hypothetical protein
MVLLIAEEETMKSPRFVYYWVILIAFALGTVAAFCRVGGADPSRISVTGSVMLDGRPLKRGTIQFIFKPFDGLHMDVTLIEDGDYAITNSGNLISGTYKVSIRSDLPEPRLGQIRQGADGIPPSEQYLVSSRYNDHSVLEVEISRRGLSKFDFDLKN